MLLQSLVTSVNQPLHVVTMTMANGPSFLPSPNSTLLYSSFGLS